MPTWQNKKEKDCVNRHPINQSLPSRRQVAGHHWCQLLSIEIAPRLLRALLDQALWTKQPELVAAVMGGAAYVVVWILWWGHCKSSEFWFTLEHELGHALMSLATANPVTALNASETGNGSVHTRGEGNWLITIDPARVIQEAA